MNKIKRLCFLASSVFVIGTAMPTLCFANDYLPNANPSGSAKNQIDGLSNSILDILFYVGVVLLAWSIGMLVLSFKNEDAEQKVRATMMLVFGATLMGLKLMVKRVFG